ncbi:MAG: hypothetical protein KA436_05970 [Oligoflexales bacterium]|nr:hypothetical protein [Oligoflexales bacterium]
MNAVLEEMQRKLSALTKGIKSKILGHNNERLDFLLDSFYKLSAAQRNASIGVGVGVLTLFVLASVSLYFSRVSALEKGLSDSFLALKELRRYKVEQQLEDKRFKKLLVTIKRKTQDLNLKPFFEKLSHDKSIPLKDISEKTVLLNSSNPFSEKVKEVQVDMRLPNISIPKLLDFIIEIEKSGHYLRVQELKITGIYGNKHFFDTSLLLRSYSVGNL